MGRERVTEGRRRDVGRESADGEPEKAGRGARRVKGYGWGGEIN